MTNKPVLVHVPKTAGHSIKALPWITYSGLPGVEVGHYTYREVFARYGHRLYFGVVRHPIDRFISCMRVVFRKKEHQYTDFFRSRPDLLLMKNITEDWVDFMVGVLDLLEAGYVPEKRNHFKSMSEQLKGCPFVIYYENLDVGLYELSQMVGVKFEISDLQHLGKTNETKPTLDSGIQVRIKNIYHEDMERFYS